MSKVGTIAIVGGGLAGAKAAEALRKDGFDGRVRCSARRPSSIHPAPPVQGVPARRGRARQGLRPSGGVVRRAAHRPEQSTTVTAIDAASNEVILDGGRRVAFDRLVIATGSEPTRLDVPGSDLAGIRYLRTLDNSDGLRDAAGAATQVVVIGSGWIGAEVAASIRQLGREVALVADTSVPLERMLGTEVGAIFGDVHAHHGVRLVTNQRVVAVHGRDGAVDAVETADGTRIDADLVVVGIGATPRTALAEAAGLAVDDGILVDEHLELSAPASSPPATSPTPCTRSPGRGSASSTGTTPAARAVSRPQRAGPRRGVRAGAVLLLRPVRPQHGVRGVSAALRPRRLPRRPREWQVPRVLARAGTASPA